MDSIRYKHMEIETMDMNSSAKMQVEQQCADVGDSDNDNISNNLNKPYIEWGDWMCESSDTDDEEGFEGWPAWSPASFKSNDISKEGFKGLLQ
jgi:hypothetical protein